MFLSVGLIWAQETVVLVSGVTEPPRLVTVFLRGPIRLRPQAIARFYREFGLPPPVTGRATRREKPQTPP